MARKALSTAFVLIAVVHLAALFLQKQEVAQITKPLLIPALGIGLLYQRKFPTSLLVALVFSWMGDVLLMNPQPISFQLGLGAFLVAQLFYILTFRKTSFSKRSSTAYSISISVLVLGYVWALLYILIPHLDGFLVPILLYATVISCMLWVALNRKGKTNNQSFYFVAVGAGLFVLSDSLIALNKFVNPIPHSGVMIMLTYLLAQALLVRGTLKSS